MSLLWPVPGTGRVPDGSAGASPPGGEGTQGDFVSSHIAIYVDFDNIVISAYDAAHGPGAWRNDRPASSQASALARQRLTSARIKLRALRDFAATFGNVAHIRAYGNWATGLAKVYSPDMLGMSVDTIQVFPQRDLKNGADIRLALDAYDDLLRYPHLSHIMIVAGDSDYVSLAQRARLLDRFVVGVGVSGNSSRNWQKVCDEFHTYEQVVARTSTPGAAPPATVVPDLGEALAPTAAESETVSAALPLDASRDLLLRATNMLSTASDDDWIAAGGLKTLMRRMEPQFDESALGFTGFSTFIGAFPQDVEIEHRNAGHFVRLRHSSGTGSDEPSAAAPLTPAEPGADAGPGAEPTPPPAEVADVRRRMMLPASIPLITEEVEDAAFQAVQRLFRLSQDLELLDLESSRPVLREAMVADGVRADLATQAARFATGGRSFLLRDGSLRLSPNPDFVEDAAAVRRELRWSILSQIRGANAPAVPPPAGVIIEALYGQQLGHDEFTELLRSYEPLLATPTWRQMAAAVGSMLIPPQILWDVCWALDRVPENSPIGTIDALQAHLQAPLTAIERAPETVPMQAVFSTMQASGVLGDTGSPSLTHPPAGSEGRAADYAQAFVTAWLEQLRTSRCGVDLEGLYRLALPDRLEVSHRALVRSWVTESTAAAA